jgi:hypothetical protein
VSRSGVRGDEDIAARQRAEEAAQLRQAGDDGIAAGIAEVGHASLVARHLEEQRYGRLRAKASRKLGPAGGRPLLRRLPRPEREADDAIVRADAERAQHALSLRALVVGRMQMRATRRDGNAEHLEHALPLARDVLRRPSAARETVRVDVAPDPADRPPRAYASAGQERELRGARVRLDVDHPVVATRAETADLAHRARGIVDEQLARERLALEQRRRGAADEKIDARIGKGLAQVREERRREQDVAEPPQLDEQDAARRRQRRLGCRHARSVREEGGTRTV